jgi:RNA polymerase sigma-70 factor, ECF subfamily
MIDTTPQDISLEALKAGERSAYASLVEAYSAPIYRLGLRMLNSELDAEDVLQNTFLKAFEHIGEFEGRSSLATWLYRVAANEALMLLRRKRPEVNIDDFESDDEDDDLTPSIFVDWGALPEDELLSAEGRQALDRAIASLPETLRVVFILRDIDGLSIKETADVLKLTETNVKTRLLRARLQLREQLSAYYSERLSRE